MPQRRRSSFVPWTSSLVLISAAVAFSPRQANAECGDYVTILNGKSATEHGKPDPTADHKLPKTPCHGPNCSNHVPTPFVPLPPSVNPSSETKACVDGLADEANFGAKRTITNSSNDGPVQRPSSIFHPPRG